MRGTRAVRHSQRAAVGIIPAYAGNTRLSSKNNAQPYGSSPRMRGTLVAVLFSFVQLGIIPAYAGNTETDATTATSTADHPRVCGEHLAYFKVERRYYGIIPAYAGNTAQGKLSHADVWDHPRVCGEHMPKASGVNVASGSSPRVRGTLLRVRAERQSTGIIPAYAGNTPPCPGRAAIHWDHPRVCGEHTLSNRISSGLRGSSPRMRGTPLVVWGDSCDEGIIPAYAGNTPRAAWTPRSCRDHPRVCGEHVSCSATTEPVVGSSPRMRGTRFKCARQSSTTGIIPAYAGNTVRPYPN